MVQTGNLFWLGQGFFGQTGDLFGSDSGTVWFRHRSVWFRQRICLVQTEDLFGSAGLIGLIDSLSPEFSHTSSSGQSHELQDQ